MIRELGDVIGQLCKSSQSQARPRHSQCLPAKFEIARKQLVASIMDLENEVYFLKEEIIRLKEENEGLQQDRELAGEIGKNLLENNQELEKKLEEVNNNYISTLGNLEVKPFIFSDYSRYARRKTILILKTFIFFTLIGTQAR